MATEARIQNTKKDWIAATSAAISAKANARKSYEEAKANHLTNDSFSDWVQQNDYEFFEAYQSYEAANAAFLQALAQRGPREAQEFQGKQHDLRRYYEQGQLGDGKERGSRHIIVSYDEVERYDAIVQAMQEAYSKAHGPQS
ncbi:hypothetical protein N7452_001400 [Penicillium brevicompactum]|uniref:Uncharacterized protein n=1 Tax=Penicillium brevicompactum TaxID=5074 RepID=A0A9W9R2E7_PENBR|nr:hypothetical protein N7452_001400 [Penicillium brevicompactum]